jgi:hypothetical protein
MSFGANYFGATIFGGGESAGAHPTDAETGTAADAGETIAVAVSDADTATAVDAGETVALTTNDDGSQTDAGETIANAITDTETGVVDDEGAFFFNVTDTETGTAVDAGERVGIATFDADTAVEVEAESIDGGRYDNEIGTSLDNGFVSSPTRDAWTGPRHADCDIESVARGDTFDIHLTNIVDDRGAPAPLFAGDRLAFTLKWTYARHDTDTVIGVAQTIGGTQVDATFSILPADWNVLQLARSTTAVWDVQLARAGDPNQTVTLARGTIRVFADAVLVSP